MTTFHDNARVEIVLKYGAGLTHHIFGSYAEALAVVEALHQKMGLRFSNDPDTRTHKIVGLEGTAVVVVDEISLARAIDCIAANAMIKPAEASE